MAGPGRNWWNSSRRSTQARSSDTIGLTIEELRLFLEGAAAYGIPDDAPVFVGGLSFYADVQGEKWYWVTRVETHHDRAVH